VWAFYPKDSAIQTITQRFYIRIDCYIAKIKNSQSIRDMNNDSMPPKYTTFHHLAYVARWSPTTF
jgi:hypothetical protein